MTVPPSDPASDATETPRTWPALDVVLHDAPDRDSPSDAFACVLDDVQATAVEASPDGCGWRASFESPGARDRAAHTLNDCPLVHLVVSRDVADEGWATRVQQDLRAVRVGRLVVAPPWDAPAAGSGLPGEFVIVIEPSMGFGTGHHQSTRLCLELLQTIALEGARVLDVGTGSGVLAIAAMRLGARDVRAIDNDPDSVTAARDNVVRNQTPSIVVLEADVQSQPREAYDLVVANLTVWILRKCAAALDGLVAPGGRLLLSGFTVDQRDLLLAAFPSFDVQASAEEDDWVALVLQRTSSAM